MREIKFRGKRLDNGEWVYFNLHGTYVDENGNEISPKKFIRDCGFKVAPETEGQYTGLKDKNGKEIYEGDILYCGGWSGVPYLKPYAMPEKHSKGENFIVVKMDCGFVLRHISAFGETSEKFFYTPNAIIKGWPIVNNYDFWNLQRSYEVIGNVYENSELVKS